MQDSFCKTEEEALEGTGGSGAQPSRPQRRLKLFAVVTSEDDMMQLQQVGQANSEELFMQGADPESKGLFQDFHTAPLGLVTNSIPFSASFHQGIFLQALCTPVLEKLSRLMDGAWRRGSAPSNTGRLPTGETSQR